MRGVAFLALTMAFAGVADAREPAGGGWRLVWSDEFDGSVIDRGKWDFDVDCWGGGNSERQCYTDRPANAAVRDGKLLGFACHDATAKGFFGPTGVDEAARGQGIGEALLIATLRGMREAGYGYAVIGDPGPVAFYQKRLDALEIPKSKPGIYAGMLRARPRPQN